MALKVKFLPSQAHRWRYFSGNQWKSLVDADAAPETGLFQLTMFESEGISASDIKKYSLSDPHLFQATTGAWTIVEITPNQVTLISDRIRSFPLYWAWQDDVLWISDNYQSLTNQISTTVDELSLEAFYFSGYTLGERTFSEEISCLGAGQKVVLRNPKLPPFRIQTPNQYFVPAKDAVTDPEIFQKRMQSVLDKELSQLVREVSAVDVDDPNPVNSCKETAPDGLTSASEDTDNKSARFLIPLSGGLDSRLLASWFARNRVPNVLCFTYGLAGCAEMAVSKQVADKLGLPWVGVELDPQQVQAAWQQPQTAQILNYASAGTALAHVQDWYALRYLLDQGIIHPGDVVLPGHTVIWNFTNLKIAEQPNRSLPELCGLLWKQHYQLHPDLPSPALKQEFKAQVKQILQQTGACQDKRSLQVFMEYFMLVTRKVKYITNSVRVYEALDLRWSLPMLHDDFMQTWFTGCYDLTASRDFFHRWIDEYFAETCGETLSYQTTRSTRLPKPVKRTLQTVANATGINQRIQHHLSVRAQLPHSLGLHLYLSGLSDDDIRGRLKAHTPLLGLWAEQFLDGSWHPNLTPLSTDSPHSTHLPR